MPTGVYLRTEKHSFNKGKKHPNRKPYFKGMTKIDKICLFCQKAFVTDCLQPKKKFCSLSCSSKSRPEMNLANLNKRNKEKQRAVVSARRGEKHPQWIKDRTISIEKHRLRGTEEWSKWREFIFKRDSYTCQECNETGKYLEPHHIVPLRLDITRIFDTDNGISLCRDCHKKTFFKEELFAQRYIDKIIAYSRVQI